MTLRPLLAALAISLVGPLPASAEVVCSYPGDLPPVCCDTEIEYCVGFGVYRRQVWEDIQGRWSGTVRLKQNSCPTSPSRSFSTTLAVTAPVDLDDPERGGSLGARTKNFRYAGVLTGAEGVDDPHASFERTGPKMGRCYTRNRIEMPYLGGRTSPITFVAEAVCSGAVACRVVHSGRVRRATPTTRR